MKTHTTVTEMRAARARMTGTVGLVPTMGYLHEGHLSLVRRSLRDNPHTVVSIFVNPTQFGPNEDFERYPRDEARDIALLQEILRGPQDDRLVVFAPAVEEMYPPGFDEWVELHGPLVERFEGEHRPGHFRGVTTIVARLFRIIQPDRAYFGQKDAQQLRVVRRMVQDLRLPVEIVAMPVIREPDGLAMSSRNVYLSPQERSAALVLSRSLRHAESLVAGGETDARKLVAAVAAMVHSEPRVTLEYAALVDEETMEDIETLDRPGLLLVLGRLGNTRLLDNAILIPPGVEASEELRGLVYAPPEPTGTEH
jgi:pantoate--beta-alanine ligase